MFSTTLTLESAGRSLLLDRPRIVGIVNVTPDSFSDGAQHAHVDAAVAHALRLVEEGADALDIGGESTRPGADSVSVDQELSRVIPVIKRLSGLTQVPIWIDTSKPEVMRAAVAAGASGINDVYALRMEGALQAAAELRVPVCLMHMQGEPRSMQANPHYDDVTAEVHRFLADRIFACEMSGIDKKRLMVDPGFGFGKTLEHNLRLLAELNRFADLGVPILVGLSRKSMIGAITGRPVDQRATASAVAAAIAVQNGALLLRVHDVSATRDALAIWQAVREVRPAKNAHAESIMRWSDDD